MRLKSYAKINLSLDVKGFADNGYHLVDMIMQQIDLHDELNVEWREDKKRPFEIYLKTNKYYLPVDKRNLAYSAALLMNEISGGKHGRLYINIKKNIPVAAGLAGGSGNGAAVIHALNRIWHLGLDINGLCEAGRQLGSDVPFCIMGQAAQNRQLRRTFAKDPMAAHCALASGTGTDMEPVDGLDKYIVLSKPPVSVSTAEVYKGIDEIDIPLHPDNTQMIKDIRGGQTALIEKNMVNVLENFTLKRYPIVMYTKDKMLQLCDSGAVLMSGSGPTVFCICDSSDEAMKVYNAMKQDNNETYMTRTTVTGR